MEYKTSSAATAQRQRASEKHSTAVRAAGPLRRPPAERIGGNLGTCWKTLFEMNLKPKIGNQVEMKFY